MADSVEAIQLDMASDLLGHADEPLDAQRAPPEEVRFLAGQLRAALRDVRRVAESRGARLVVSERRRCGADGPGLAEPEGHSSGG